MTLISTDAIRDLSVDVWMQFELERWQAEERVKSPFGVGIGSPHPSRQYHGRGPTWGFVMKK